MGSVLMAIACEGDRRRIYIEPDDSHSSAASADGSPTVSWLKCDKRFLYGFHAVADLFTNQQLVALTTFSDLVGKAKVQVQPTPAQPDYLPAGQARADAVATYLAFAISRSTNRSSTITGWDSSTKMEV